MTVDSTNHRRQDALILSACISRGVIAICTLQESEWSRQETQWKQQEVHLRQQAQQAETLQQDNQHLKQEISRLNRYPYTVQCA